MRENSHHRHYWPQPHVTKSTRREREKRKHRLPYLVSLSVSAIFLEECNSKSCELRCLFWRLPRHRRREREREVYPRRVITVLSHEKSMEETPAPLEREEEEEDCDDRTIIGRRREGENRHHTIKHGERERTTTTTTATSAPAITATASRSVQQREKEGRAFHIGLVPKKDRAAEADH